MNCPDCGGDESDGVIQGLAHESQSTCVRFLRARLAQVEKRARLEEGHHLNWKAIAEGHMDKLEDVEKDALGIIRSFVAAFRAYEVDVEGEPSPAHRSMMERAEAFRKAHTPKECSTHRCEVCGVEYPIGKDHRCA